MLYFRYCLVGERLRMNLFREWIQIYLFIIIRPHTINFMKGTCQILILYRPKKTPQPRRTPRYELLGADTVRGKILEG